MKSGAKINMRAHKISKLIHQTVTQKDQLTAEILSNIQYIKKLNPGWEHRLYDEKERTNYIRKNFSAEIYKWYTKISEQYGPAKADLFRYLVIYKEGGVYLDIKSSMLKPLDEIILESDSCLLSYWPEKLLESFGHHPELAAYPKGEFQQWFLISEPLHPYFKAVINDVISKLKSYSPSVEGVAKPAVLKTTGPITFTLTVGSCLYMMKHRIVDSRSDLGLVYTIYENIDPMMHVNNNPNHYSKLSTPLIRQGPRELLLRTIRKMRKYISN